MIKEGDKRTQIATRRECEYCSKLAVSKFSFLLPNYRTNPASSAYGKDDCSRCSDHIVYTCAEHGEPWPTVEPYGQASGRYPYENFKHLFLLWKDE